MRMEYLVFLLAYFLLVLGLSFGFARRQNNLEDYFLASRKLPWGLVYVSLGASWLGATSVLVSVEQAFSEGIGAVWVMMIPALVTVSVLALFLSGPIRRLTRATLPELVEQRYGRGVRHAAAVLIVWYMILLASSQMVAIGGLIRHSLGVSFINGLLIGTGVVLVYSAFGGLFSVVLTDGLQLGLLIIGGGGLFGLLWNRGGGAAAFSVAGFSGRPGYTDIFSGIETNGLMALSFVMAWLISPIAWQRIQAASSERSARRGLWAAGGTFLAAYAGLIAIGMMAYLQGIFPRPGEPLMFTLLELSSNPALSGVFFVAVMAAVMSTMDTALNTGAFSLTHDVWRQIFPTSRDGSLVLVSRLATLIIGGLALLIALRFQSILKTLGLSAEIMAEGLFIPGILMLFQKKKRPTAGLLSLLLGGGFALLGFFCEVGWLGWDLPDWPHSLPYGVGLSLAGFLAGACWDRHRPRLGARRFPTDAKGNERNAPE